MPRNMQRHSKNEEGTAVEKAKQMCDALMMIVILCAQKSTSLMLL